MKINLLYEPDQIVEITRKFTAKGFMVCTGGSISVCDSDGTIYITPDKFDSINPESKKIIVIDKNEKKYYDIKKASVELPIHNAIYEKRLDVNAICHVYSPALTAISPTTNQSVFNLFPRLNKKLGVTHFSEYVTNYNNEQVNAFVSRFANGASNIIVDATGVFTTGRTLEEAYHRAELLDHFAKIYLNSIQLGDLMYPAEDNIQKFNEIKVAMPQYLRGRKSSKELDSVKMGLCRLALYAYQKNMATSLLGSMSVRLSKESYLTIPGDTDKSMLDPEKLVMMKHGKSEAWKTPNEDLMLHEIIYDKNPSIDCIAFIFPTLCTAYSFTDVPLEIEGLKIGKLPFETIFNLNAINKAIKEGFDVLMIENDLFIVVASDMQVMNVILDKLTTTCRENINSMAVS
ncbi:MAG: class II aldolase/adducin family protein [Bacteroidales bacterium]|nr:class II aldolase/adducin family protein [Bacteroidales bacterium]MCF8457265.1 class II aldolase/adducin family protein [Bacteroidales bacterium]